MLSSKNRLDKKGVDLVFKKGEFIDSSNLMFRFIINNNFLPPRISFVASKNISKLAVKRNLLRRKGYSALKECVNRFPPGTLGVFVFKKYQDNILTIKNEIKNILGKIN